MRITDAACQAPGGVLLTEERGAPVLTLQDVAVGHGTLPAVLEHASFSMRPGERIALVGESGAGKTTVLRAVAGLIAPRAGTITVMGTPPPGRPPRGTVGYIPQRLGLVRHATVLENVLIGTLHREPAWRVALKLPGPAAVEAARDALTQVGIAHKADSAVKHLSGGQQRRVAVARALAGRPRLLLADEFLSELDHRTAETVEAAVMSLAETAGTAILFVEHHVAKARRMADRVFEIHERALVDISDPRSAQGRHPQDEEHHEEAT